MTGMANEKDDSSGDTEIRLGSKVSKIFTPMQVLLFQQGKHKHT